MGFSSLLSLSYPYADMIGPEIMTLNDYLDRFPKTHVKRHDSGSLFLIPCAESMAARGIRDLYHLSDVFVSTHSCCGYWLAPRVESVPAAADQQNWWIEDKYSGAGVSAFGGFKWACDAALARCVSSTTTMVVWRLHDNERVAEIELHGVKWVSPEYR